MELSGCMITAFVEHFGSNKSSEARKHGTHLHMQVDTQSKTC